LPEGDGGPEVICAVNGGGESGTAADRGAAIWGFGGGGRRERDGTQKRRGSVRAWWGRAACLLLCDATEGRVFSLSDMSHFLLASF
jgi:hypothetical protein